MIHERAHLIDDISPDLFDKIRARKHVFISWKSQISYIMMKQFFETGGCDFAFGITRFFWYKAKEIYFLKYFQDILAKVDYRLSFTFNYQIHAISIVYNLKFNTYKPISLLHNILFR